MQFTNYKVNKQGLSAFLYKRRDLTVLLYLIRSIRDGLVSGGSRRTTARWECAE